MPSGRGSVELVWIATVALLGAQAGAAEPALRIASSAPRVGRYEKIEWSIDLETPYQNPFATARLREASATVAEAGVRAIGLQGRDCAYLWLFDREAAWVGRGVEGVKPSEIRGATVRIENLAPGRYRVEWFDTHEGRITGRETVEADATGMVLHLPDFARDVACKVVAADGRQAAAAPGRRDR